MRLRYLISLLISLLFVSGAYCAVTDASYLLLNFTKNIDLSVKYGAHPVLKEVKIVSRENPLETSYTHVVDFTSNTYYGYDPATNDYVFHISNIKRSDVRLKLNFIVESFKSYPSVRNASYTPVDNKYTQFGSLINVNSDIRKKASELANGVNNSFEIAVRVADWVSKNVKYDLDSVSQVHNASSTWVFKHRVGVCRQMTSLFVSMMRSLGIPSRVVVGFAYTNDPQFKKRWSGHAWAEVYIDGKWVPFDVTYGEYGYVDPSHIPFRKVVFFNGSVDDLVELKGSDLTISSFNTSYVVKVLGNRSFRDDRYQVSVMYDDRIGFGSKDYIKVRIKNLEDSYIHLFINIAGPKEMAFNTTKMSLVVKPLGVKEVYFNYKISNQLDPEYIYKFPVEIYNSEYSKNFTIYASDRYPYYQKVKVVQDNHLVLNPRIKVSVNCSCVYLNPFEYDCKVRNLNPFEIKNISFCIGNECRSEHFLVNEIKRIRGFSVNRELNVSIGGNFSSTVTCTVPELQYSYYVNHSLIFINYSLTPNYVYRLSLMFNNRTLLLNNSGQLVLRLKNGRNFLNFNVLYNNTRVMNKSIRIFNDYKEVSHSFFYLLIKEWVEKILDFLGLC